MYWQDLMKDFAKEVPLDDSKASLGVVLYCQDVRHGMTRRTHKAQIGQGSYWGIPAPHMRAKFHNVHEVFLDNWGISAPLRDINVLLGHPCPMPVTPYWLRKTVQREEHEAPDLGTPVQVCHRNRSSKPCKNVGFGCHAWQDVALWPAQRFGIRSRFTQWEDFECRGCDVRATLEWG